MSTHVRNLSDTSRARLALLAKVLREDAAKPDGVTFDLGNWAMPVSDLSDIGEDSRVDTKNWQIPEEKISNVGGWEYAPADVLEPIPVSCGTSACALGLAALTKEFQDMGLSYKYQIVTPQGHTENTRGAWMIPEYLGFHGLDAGAAFFGISTEDASYFFDPDQYDRTPTHAKGEILVAERIEAFLDGCIDHDHHDDYRDDDEG